MKKSVKIIIVAAIAILVILGITIGIIFVKLNKEKQSITASTFVNNMEQKGYYVIDSTTQFEDYDYIKESYIAADSDYNFQVEFYSLEDENYAISFFDNNKSIFETSEGDSSAQTNVSFKNYSKFTLTANGEYIVVSRIDNTVMYAYVNSEYKDTVKAIFDEFGY